MSDSANIRLQLEALGLDIEAVSEPEALERSSEGESKGFVSQAAIDIANLDPSEGSYIPSAVADSAGFDLKRYHIPGARIIELFHESGEAALLSPPPAEDAVWRNEEGFVRVDLARHPHDVLVARAPDGSNALVFSREVDDFALCHVALRPILKPMDTIAAPIQAWLAESVDTTLVDELSELAQVAGVLGVMIAAGALARFGAEPKKTRDELVRMMLAGEALPEPAPYVWARALSEDELAKLESLAMARADLLEEQLERLLEDDNATQANIQAVSQARADLGSVRALLAVANQSKALDASLEVCDALGVALKDDARFGEVDFFANERMMRELTVSPDAWWTHRALVR